MTKQVTRVLHWFIIMFTIYMYITSKRPFNSGMCMIHQFHSLFIANSPKIKKIWNIIKLTPTYWIKKKHNQDIKKLLTFYYIRLFPYNKNLYTPNRGQGMIEFKIPYTSFSLYDCHLIIAFLFDRGNLNFAFYYELWTNVRAFFWPPKLIPPYIGKLMLI